MRQVWAREDGVFTLVDTCSVYKNGSVFLIISIEVNGSRIIVSNSHSYYFLDDIKPECLEVEQEIVWTMKKRDTQIIHLRDFCYGIKCSTSLI